MRRFSKRVLRKGFTELLVVKGDELEEEDSPLTFRDELSAQSFLRGFLGERSSMTSLRDHLSRERVVADLSRLDDQRMIREFAKHLVSGRFRIISVGRIAPQVGWTPTGDTAQRERETAEERPPRRPAVFPEESTPLHWVQLLVVDDETDEPVPGVKMRVKLPSGRVTEPSTDQSGTIYIGDVDPGTLDILEILDDDALEVVRIE